MATKSKQGRKAKKAKWRKPTSYVQIACFVYPRQRDALKALSERTRVPQQAHLREAIDDLLDKYRGKQ